jgi:hypothetical protein
MYPLNVQLPAGAGFAVANDADEHQTLTDAGYLPAIEAAPVPVGKVGKRWGDKRPADDITKAV